MIIICPECATQFAVPDNAIGQEGRKVKCKNCAHIWLQLPEIEDEHIKEDLSPKEKILNIIKFVGYKKLAYCSILLAFVICLAIFSINMHSFDNKFYFQKVEMKKDNIDDKIVINLDIKIKNDSNSDHVLDDMDINVLSEQGRELGKVKYEIPNDINNVAAGQVISISPTLTVSPNAQTVSLDIANGWARWLR